MGIAEKLAEARDAGRRVVEIPEFGVRAIVEPEATLVAGTEFRGRPEDIAARWRPDARGDGGELLLEAAGRACYQSWRNPAERSNHEYMVNIIAQGHTSVLEHADYTFYFRGVSRSLTHEMVRHRAGCSYSQLSQRYVDSSEVAFVVPPALMDEDRLLEPWAEACAASLRAYQTLTERLEGKMDHIKKRREAARSVLPNCVETHLVMTANVRAWRHILTLRGSEHAEAEIRRLMAVILPILTGAIPLFWDFRIDTAADGMPVVLWEGE